MSPQKKIAFENQNNYRVSNDIKAIALLQKGPKTCVELAKGLGVTFTAITRIVHELDEAKLTLGVAAKADKSNKMGRRPSYVALNKSLGIVCGVDLSGQDISIALAGLDLEILCEATLEDHALIDRPVLEEVMKTIEKLLASPKTKGLPLVEICISTPGKLDQNGDFIFAKRFPDYPDIHLKAMFSERFHVKVDVYRDVKMGLVGERVFGNVPKEDNDIFFAYIDRGAGSSMLLNGHLYGGAHGLSGEVNALAPVDELTQGSLNGSFYTLTDIHQDVKARLVNTPDHPLKGLEHFHTPDLAALYEQGDPLVCGALEKSARYNAIALLSFVNLLDVEDVVIQGRIVMFGEKYRSLLEHYFTLYDLNHNTARILFSSLKGKANVLGAVYQGTNLFYLRQFGELTAKRTGSRDYVVSEHFGDNL